MDFVYQDNSIIVCIKPARVLSTDEPGGLPELVKKWKWILLFNIAMILVLKTPLGAEVNGNLAWIHIPGFPVNIQPAEIVKLGLVLYLAQLAAERKREGKINTTDFWIPAKLSLFSRHWKTPALMQASGHSC